MRLAKRLAALEGVRPSPEDLAQATEDLERDGTLPEHDAELRYLLIRLCRSWIAAEARTQVHDLSDQEVAAKRIYHCLARCDEDPAAREELRRLMADRTLDGHLRVGKGLAAGSIGGEPGGTSDEAAVAPVRGAAFPAGR